MYTYEQLAGKTLLKVTVNVLVILINALFGHVHYKTQVILVETAVFA